MKIRNMSKYAIVASLASAITAVAMSEQGRESIKVAHEAGMDAVGQRRKQRRAKQTEKLKD